MSSGSQWLDVLGWAAGGGIAGVIYFYLALRAERRSDPRVTDVTCDVCHRPVDTLPPVPEDEQRRQ